MTCSICCDWAIPAGGELLPVAGGPVGFYHSIGLFILGLALSDCCFRAHHAQNQWQRSNCQAANANDQRDVIESWD